MAKGRLVSRGRPERSCGGRVESRDTKGVTPSPCATVDWLVAAVVPGGRAGGLLALVAWWVGWSGAVGTGLGSEDAGMPVGWGGPGCLSVGELPPSSPLLVARALTGTCSAVVLPSARGPLGLETLWACMGWGIPVLLLAFVTAVVSKALWDPKEVGSLEVTAGETTGLEEELAGNSRLGKGWRGVVFIGKEPGPGTVTALVMSGKRGAGADREDTVMLGIPAKVTVTLVVFTAPDPMLGVSVCCGRARDEDSGVKGVARWLAVTLLLAGGSVGWAGRLDAVTPSGCHSVAWVGPGVSPGPSVAATGGFRAVVSGAAGVSRGLWEGAPGASCGNCSSLPLRVGSS